MILLSNEEAITEQNLKLLRNWFRIVMMTKHVGVIAVILGCVCLGGCGFEGVATGPERNDGIHLDGTNIDKANVELDMGAGQMTIGGGAAKMLDGTFTYNVDEWKPVVSDTTNGSHAAVTIKQPHAARGGGKTKYVWDLNLNDHILTDLTINCGAGQAKLELGTLTLRNLEVHMGAGQVQLDLRGQPARDYEVKVDGGVGQATIRLPKDVGIWAEAHGGIGSVTVTGLEKHGDHWENDLYNKAKVTVKLEVNGGIGEIRISG
jgi:hypothetical protein